MTSIYRRALGSDFTKLHPQIQKRFSLTSESALASIGTGTMEHIWHGAPHTMPFLYAGAWRSIVFPEQRHDAPFNIQNYAYRDPLGRETVTWVRKFATTQVRRFDAYMIYSEKRGCLVNYLGTHQHLAVDLAASVDENGGLRLRSGAQRLYEGPIGLPFPRLFSGTADVCEWYDDQEQCFRINVSVSNRLWGKLFGYDGRFKVEWAKVPPNFVPDTILPKRVEKRE
jgi:Domain of unknown function (DUF4166)